MSASDPFPRPSGRYRFRRGKPVNPQEGLHPELLSPVEVGGAIPHSPDALIAMQEQTTPHPEKPERQQSPKVQQVIALIESLQTSALEDQQISLAIVRHLESYHDGVVRELQDDDDAKHSQIVAWAIDADRLMRARLLLESVDLQ